MWNKGYEPIDAEKEVKGKWRSLSYLLALAISVVLAAISLLFLNYAPLTTTSAAIYTLADGDLVYLRMKDGRYWRVDENDKVVTSDFPWLQGSRFVLETTDQVTWKVMTRRTGNYVVIDGDTSKLTTVDVESYWYTPTTFVMRSVVLNQNLRPAAENTSAPHPLATQIPDSKDDFLGYPMSSVNVPYELSDNTVAVSSPSLRKHASSSFHKDSSGGSGGGDLFVVPVPRIRGVNIGSWFIPEKWMLSSFYDGVDDYWSQLCGLVKMKGFTEAEDRMLDHLETWFTEKDFDRLYSNGINSIRIPVGYWNIIRDPYDMYVPTDYQDSVYYLDWAFDQAEARGMKIMLDFHAAPGSQNGYDHSGCGYGSLNGERWNVGQNKQISLDAIDALAARYGKRPGLLAIELLNEPAEDLEKNHHEDLLDYYTQGYDIVRKYSDTVLVAFNVLWSDHYARWFSDLAEPRFFNVLMDWHLYDFGAASMEQHLAHTQMFDDWITNHSSTHPIVVGEWSASMAFQRGAGTDPVYVNSQLQVYAQTWGWYYWNFKIFEPGWRVWSFQSMIDDGYTFGLSRRSANVPADASPSSTISPPPVLSNPSELSTNNIMNPSQNLHPKAEDNSMMNPSQNLHPITAAAGNDATDMLPFSKRAIFAPPAGRKAEDIISGGSDTDRRPHLLQLKTIVEDPSHHHIAAPLLLSSSPSNQH